jgi:uncharacterized protein
MMQPLDAGGRALIEAIAAEVEARQNGEGSGHDWWHTWRVWRMAERIGHAEGANMLVVGLAALLHDIADWKLHDGDDTVGPRVARQIMERHGVAEEATAQVCTIIATMSFKGAGVPSAMAAIEGKVVQDADRLDAIGAIGIARAFAYGGHEGRPLHDPGMAPILHASKEDYARNTSATVNHFHEKLLLLKDLMNTSTARGIAEGRHRFMEEFLQRFTREWDGSE